MQILKETINKGVPVSTPVILKRADLTLICINSAQIERIIERHFTRYINYMNRKGIKEDFEIFSTLEIITDSNSLEKKICFSPQGLLSAIILNLNLNGRSQSNLSSNMSYYEISNFQESIEERLELLKNIKTEKDLKKHFPLLYLKYVETNKTLNDAKCLLMLQNQKNISFAKRLEINGLIVRLIQEIGRGFITSPLQLKNFNGQFPLDIFCNSYKKSFALLIEQFPDIIEYMISHPIDINQISNEDKERVELYVANQFLTMCQILPDEDKQRFLYHVTSYFNENQNRKNDDSFTIEINNINNESMGVKTEGIIISPKSLYEKYKQLLVENPQLRIIDFNDMDFSGMNLEEVEQFMLEFLKELKANWELIPPSEMQNEFIQSVTRSIGNRLSEEEKEEKKRNLVDLYIEKKSFYDSTDPFFRIVGKNTFEGYVGHIYKNGKVILEKFLESEKTGKIADNHAIYIMNISDFYRLSHLSKPELIGHPLCKRIYHKGDWQGRVLEQINVESGIKTTYEFQKLLQTGDVVKP